MVKEGEAIQNMWVLTDTGPMTEGKRLTNMEGIDPLMEGRQSRHIVIEGTRCSPKPLLRLHLKD